MKQPNTEIENKCDKAERWKREGGSEGGRGIRERAADVKIVWRGDKKTGTKTKYREKKGIEIETEIELKPKPTIVFVLFLASCLTDA